MKLLAFITFFAIIALAINLRQNPGLLQTLQSGNLSAKISDASTSDLVARCSHSLVIIEGDEGAGSGSIINFRGNSLIVTNVHVLSGNANPHFRLLNAQEVIPETFGIPDDRDICVATQRQTREGLEASTAVDKDVTIGDEVIVMGNSQGTRVATEVKGKIVGLGPELVETDAKFVSGNSGSPIIHVKTGKVIGIATFALLRDLDSLSRDSQFNKIRRFGYRIDTVPKWKFVTPAAFAAESRAVGQIKQRTDDLFALALEVIERGTVTASHYSPQSWVGGTLGIYADAMGNKVDPVRYGRAAGEFRHSMNSDLAGIITGNLLPYHQHELEKEYKSRGLLLRFYTRLDWRNVTLRR